MKAIFKTKNVYGSDLIYPINETATNLIKLTGKLTADNKALDLIKKLGYEVEIN